MNDPNPQEGSDDLPHRVLHVLCGAAGGATASTLELAAALEKKFGIRSCAVCHPAGTSEERERVRSVLHGRVAFFPLYFWNRKTRVDMWKRPLLDVYYGSRTGWARLSALRVARLARRNQINLIHTNTFLNPEGGVAARLLGLPHVWHLRELVGVGHPFQMPLSGPALGRFLRTHSSCVVANSNASARSLCSVIGTGADVTTVPNGIAFSASVDGPARVSGTAPLVVAMIANLTSHTKKHALFVDAARSLTGRGIEFRIYGHDEDAGNRYARGIKERAGREVAFCGFRPIAQILREIDVLVHPSENESFGRTVVEAMGAGIPVIGAGDGGVAETIIDGETGLLVPPDNAAALAKAIARLVEDDELRRSLAQAGRERAHESYSIDACADGVAGAYRAALLRPLSAQ